MVKAMGRHRRGSKTGGFETATVSGIVLAAIAGVAGYGLTQGELSDSDKEKIEFAVRQRLEAERAKNPRSAPCPDFKPEREKLLAKLAEYESSELRFRLATPDQIVKVVETVKEKVMAKKGGAETASEPTSVATSELVPVAEPAPTVGTPAAVEAVTETPAEKTDTEPKAPVETVVNNQTPDETVTETVAETPAAVETVADIPVTAELLPKPDLVKAGVILDSIPKAFSRPRLITVLIKLESATREPLDTLRKYFDEAFAKLEPGSKTPLKDALRKMRERGVNRFFPKKNTPVVNPTPPTTNDTTVEPIPTDTSAVEPIPTDTTVEPIPTDTTVEPIPTDTSAVEPIATAVEPVVTPVAEIESNRKLSNLGQTLATTEDDRLKTVGTVGPNIRDTIGKLNKSLKSKGGGTRKKKLRTRRRDKQNVRRSSGRKNRSNRTDTYSSRRTEVDARGDELGL